MLVIFLFLLVMAYARHRSTRQSIVNHTSKVHPMSSRQSPFSSESDDSIISIEGQPDAVL